MSSFAPFYWLVLTKKMKIRLIIGISFLLITIIGINRLQKPFDSIIKNALKISNIQVADDLSIQSAIPNEYETDAPDTIDDDDDIFDNLTKIIFFSCAALPLFSMFKHVCLRSIHLINPIFSILHRVYSQSYLQTFRI